MPPLGHRSPPLPPNLVAQSACHGPSSLAVDPFRSVLDTACEDLRQHFPSTSDVSPQVSGEYTVSFDQPVPVPDFVADNPCSVVPQPMSDGTQPHADSLILEKGADADQTKSEPLRRHSRHRRSNRAVATTRNDRDEHTAIIRQDLDLPCQLSALTNGMQHIPVRDMYAWVHRPVETRRQEALQRHGRISRPMNSFMLYRLAYSDQAKHLLAQNDHQAISILTGRSGKTKTSHIRKQYKTLAVTEKHKHAGAHPGYQFSPSTKKKRSQNAGARSQKLVLRSEAFPKVSRSSQPHAGSTSLNNDRVNEETLIQSIPSNPAGFGSLQSAASVWWREIIYSQMTSAEQVSAGTQPCFPVVTGQPGIPNSACFVPQSGCPGLEAVNSQPLWTQYPD
ncbi:hypothetical protein BDQ94DRAFT_177777 [Aspergillus welwitschiae]|uniref:HMG box domain-containing protein n=1 Tax=Aspergillus welwitschiae TaxID=1341132 RepID=A0A3F3PHT7_9EURO|nr:hypothetical protein BDQ94DRAFT_177777 [Aspergillus welwitschiae]RDH26458.1 hypothetical protein BDQ94DRAFT_177777 [Aspergillus welwitschiae]